MTLIAKEERLRDIFRELDSVIVAYSGGVDSSYVAYVANAELGPRAVCITGQSASLPEYQRAEIESVVKKFGFQHEIIRTEELENPGYRANNPDRCFFCKDELYTKLESVARTRGIKSIVDGSTVDDLGDYRPGRRAASQHAVRSPLIEAGLSKSDVRELSRRVSLPTWDKPASPCLSARIAYGTTVTIERLSKVDRGLRKDLIDELARRFRELGFKYVTLDLEGFRSGSMNEVLD